MTTRYMTIAMTRQNRPKNLRLRICLWAAILLFATFAPSAFCQPISRPAPDSLAGEIESLVSSGCQNAGVPGYAICVAKNGRVIYQAGFGLADINARRPATPETIFGLASVTKTFTALSLLTLVDQKQISLDDTVDKYLPKVCGKWKKLTIRQLASMTAGMRKGIPQELPWLQEMKILEKQPLLFEPGTNYEYSNPSYRLLGTIIEKVTGQDLLTVISTRITQPLGMYSTNIPESLASTGLLSAGYDNGKGTAPLRAVNYKPTAISFAAGMLFSNVIDLTRYAQALMNGQIISPESYQTYFYDRPNVFEGKPANWAFGWGSKRALRFGGQRRISMNGGDPAISSTVIMLPESKVSIVCLSNLNGPKVYSIAESVARLMMRDNMAGEQMPDTEEPQELYGER